MATPPSSAKPDAARNPDLASLRITEAKRKAPRRGRLWIWLLLAALLIVLLAAGAYGVRTHKPEVEVAAARAPATGPAGVLNASGYVTPRRRATIAAKITGRVTGVYFDEGTRLKPGQLLATLDDLDVRRALESAKADRDTARAGIQDYEVQLRNAQIELRRAQELQKAGVQTQQALDNALTSVDSLKAKIALTKQQVIGSEARIREQEQAVANCTIVAPFAGIAVSKDAQIGEMVSPISAGGGFTRTGIATIVDLHSNEFEVDVNEAFIARVLPNQRVNAVLDAYPDWTIYGKVRTVIPSADRQKATVKVRISLTDKDYVKLFDPASDPRILPDMGVKVTFLEGEANTKKLVEKSPAAAVVPQEAIRTEGGAKVVYVLRGDVLERRAVTVGAKRGSDVEILAGLQPDTQVVVKGPETLKDGETVQIKK
jgi:RND family efflux transporter MFP subunit